MWGVGVRRVSLVKALQVQRHLSRFFAYNPFDNDFRVQYASIPAPTGAPFVSPSAKVNLKYRIHVISLRNHQHEAPDRTPDVGDY